MGDLLHSGVISYLAITDVQSQLTALSSDIVYYREPSYGTFSTNARIQYLFGVPQSVEMTGVLMDMDRMKSSAECKVNCWNNWVDFNRNTGAALSAYEHIVPEQIFSTETDPVEGISAVKALSIASQQGQRIYTITEDNLTTALSHLTIEPTIKNEIRTAVQSGMEATVSQNPITYAGWTGTGYTIIDPDTGAGAYKISGGANGAFIFITFAAILLIAMSAIYIGGLTAIIGIPLAIFQAISYAGFLDDLSSTVSDKDKRIDELSKRSITTVLAAITSVFFAGKIVNSAGINEIANRIWRGVLLSMFALLGML